MFADLPPGWPPGYGRLVLASVDSTNAEAARRASETAQPTWILGLRQTRGRGRRGRPWQDPDGNFAATLLMPAPGTPTEAAQRSFVAALSLRDALVAAGVAPDAVALKWPNDVLVAGGKAAGILLESAGAGGNAAIGPLAVGVGVNLRTAPPAGALETGAMPPASLHEAAGIEMSPEALLDRLARAYAGWETRFAMQGFAPVRRAFLAHAVRLGQEVTARGGGTEITGIFADIDRAGAIVMHTARGAVTLPAAEIHF